MKKSLKPISSNAEVSAFLDQLAMTPAPPAPHRQGRLLFAMDATASREHSWDQACDIQAQMFQTTAGLGGLQVQLCYYRGFHEFHHTPWLQNAQALARFMTEVRCAGGMTQIAKVLDHGLREARRERVNALVFIGDCMEEHVDHLCAKAGELGLLGVRVFIFHEGNDNVAESAFREICRLSRGAYCRFDAASAQQLRELLSAVAAYAAGGQQALDKLALNGNALQRRLSQQLQNS